MRVYVYAIPIRLSLRHPSFLEEPFSLNKIEQTYFKDAKQPTVESLLYTVYAIDTAVKLQNLERKLSQSRLLAANVALLLQLSFSNRFLKRQQNELLVYNFQNYFVEHIFRYVVRFGGKCAQISKFWESISRNNFGKNVKKTLFIVFFEINYSKQPSCMNFEKNIDNFENIF